MTIMTLINEVLEHEWIPVSKQLPKTTGRYLVTCRDKTLNGCYYYETKECVFGLGTGWKIKTSAEITAWQLLPEPYKEEEEDDE